MDEKGTFQFDFVSDRKPRSSALAASFVVQALVILLLIHFGAVQARQTILLSAKRYQFVELAASTSKSQSSPPHSIATKPAIARPDLAHLFETRVAPVLPAPQPIQPEITVEQKAVVSPPRVPQVGQFQSAQVSPRPTAHSAPVLVTGGFSSGSSAPATAHKLTSREVQTGGFGDPNGVHGETGRGRVAPAAVGAFDLPGGAGHGNGTGGSRGARGTIASAGFGNGVATAYPGSLNGAHSARGAIQQSGFGDARVVERPRVAGSHVSSAGAASPVEIVSKPNPAYTNEARAMKLEGEVLLEVVFAASGETRVTRVVRGLGHGLDQSAIRAAQHIRFKPARRDGQPVDSTSVIHVVFQLAY